jgi:ribosomal protein S27E
MQGEERVSCLHRQRRYAESETSSRCITDIIHYTTGGTHAVSHLISHDVTMQGEERVSCLHRQRRYAESETSSRCITDSLH